MSQVAKHMSQGLVLLRPNPDRFFSRPIQYPQIHEYYVKHQKAFWTADEVSLTEDKHDWKHKLNDNERRFVRCVLGFFAGADGLVNENLLTRFSTEVQLPEARAFYSFQIGMEQIHSDMYGRMIEDLIPSRADQMETLRLCQNATGSIGLKAQWIDKWTKSDQPFALRLVAFAAVEGIFFSASFCAIFWLKKRNLMPGLCKSNEFISRDEGLHRDFACLLLTIFKMLDTPQKRQQATDIIKEAVRCEKAFVDDALHVDLIGMNSKLMKQYVECVADHLLLSMELEACYKAQNPFDFMDLIAMQTKQNFFEGRPTSYQMATDFEIDPNEDF